MAELFPRLFCEGFFFLRSFAGTIYLLSFVGVFSCTFSQVVLPWVFFCGGIFFCSSWGPFYRAVFGSGDIHGLIPLNILRAFLCRAHFRALFCSGFFSAFFRVAPVHFSTEPFCVRSLARHFPWAFSQGVPPLHSFAWTVSIYFFAGSFSVHDPEGNFLVHFFRGLLRAYCCM